MSLGEAVSGYGVAKMASPARFDLRECRGDDRHNFLSEKFGMSVSGLGERCPLTRSLPGLDNWWFVLYMEY
jgi:hypothetical protein